MSSIRKNLDLLILYSFALGIGIGCAYAVHLSTGLQNWIFIGIIYAIFTTAILTVCAWFIVNDFSDDPIEDYPMTFNNEPVTEELVGMKDLPMLFGAALLAIFSPLLIGIAVLFVAVNYTKNLLLRAVIH